MTSTFFQRSAMNVCVCAHMYVMEPKHGNCVTAGNYWKEKNYQSDTNY
jgi:hypothetical protein